MSFITFGGGRQFNIDISAPTMIGQGAGVHQLWFPVQLDARNTIGGGVSVSLTGQAWIGPARHDYLGPFTTAEAVATFEGQRIPANIVLPVSDEQLAVIEQRRAGGDLTFWLDINVVLGYDPVVASGDHNDRWPARQAQDSISVQGEVWDRLLKNASTGMSLAIVVPVPLDRSIAGRAGVHLREAIRKVNVGEYSDAVTEARKAMEAAGDPERSWKSAQEALQTGKDSRSLGQRLTIARYAIYGLASPAAHGDQNASTVKWNRETALAVIASVAALLASGHQQ
jgi:hypothetical protein